MRQGRQLLLRGGEVGGAGFIGHAAVHGHQFKRDIQGEQGGGGIPAHVAGDQGQAVNQAFGMGPQAQFAGLRDQGGAVPFAGHIGQLDRRFVGPLANGLDIALEEQIPHGGIAGHDNFVDFPPLEAKTLA